MPCAYFVHLVLDLYSLLGDGLAEDGQPHTKLHGTRASNMYVGICMCPASSDDPVNLIVRHGCSMGNAPRGEAVVDNTIVIVATGAVGQGVTGLRRPDSYL